VCCSLLTPYIVKKTFEAAGDSGNALLAQVKANQQGLLTTLQGMAPEHPPSSASRALIPKAMAGMEIVGSRTPTFRANYMPSGTA
jgi:hypothetical protein